MVEEFKIEQPNNKDTEIIKFFESRGYENVQRADYKNFNDIFFATKNGEKCFIKKYNSRAKSDKVNAERANNELTCYENLPKDILIDVIEINTSEKYLALKKVELEKPKGNKQYVEEFTDLALNKFSKIDASFLPETSWEDYEKIFVKLKNLENNGMIEGADEIIEIFKNKKDLIINAKKSFSHRDFNRLNIQKVDGKLKAYDFELARQDNAMVDMASMHINLSKDNELTELFKEKIQKSKLYNEELLNLMIIRRTTDVMNAFMDKFKAGDKQKFFNNNLGSFEEAVNKLKTNQ